jgi:hypothetical protein
LLFLSRLTTHFYREAPTPIRAQAYPRIANTQP